MRFRLLSTPLATLALAIAVSPAAAQQPSDADALAAQLRIIAARPTDVDALAQAGELSARLGDLSGAAALLARADKADPRNGRVKAGMAQVLLRSERPGEALRYYDQAEGYGYPVARFAAERGLAYDLVGQQGRAQRDYRTALAAGATDTEVTRRYALSLAISGQKDAALQLLDPLIRRNDRGAWRARAFVLAMAGDVAGADAIATTMMPAGQSQGLAPFFARLPTLGPVDRAFAVQYGEVRPTPQRLADARLAPALPPLAPEVVPVARAAPVTALAATTTAHPGGKPSRGGDRQQRGRTQVAAASSAVSPTSEGATVPAPAATTVPATQVAVAQSSRSRPPAAYYLPGSLLPHYLPSSPSSGSRPSVASANGVSSGQRPPTPTPVAAPAASAGRTPNTTVPASAVPAPPVALASNVPLANPRVVAPAPVVSAAPAPALRPSPVAGATPAGPAAATPTGSAPPAPAGVQAVALPPSVPAAAAPASAPVAAAPATPALAAQTPPAYPETDAILARIVGALATPGRELAEAGERAVAAPPPAAARNQPASVVEPRADPRPVAAAIPEPAPSRRGRGAEQEQPASALPDEPRARRGRRSRAAAEPVEVADAATGHRRATTPDEEAAAPVLEATARRGSKATSTPDAPETPAERRAARKAAVEKKAAADRKAEADREAAEERRVAKAEPRRFWVQVAGGANEDDLPKAWASAKDRSAALAGKKGWTTPLRATNRVLAGPFKTDEEARGFVNTLKKQGLPAFQFTSEAGQKITRLDGK